ncbi:MAG: MerR family transcriptional regulator, partial [Corynebacterium matruchotii]
MSAIPQPTGPDPKPINIGEVLKLLTPEFPDITLSKIRYLESEGLVSPQRTSSASVFRAWSAWCASACRS